MHPSHLPRGGSPPVVPVRASTFSPHYIADDPRGWQIGWRESGGLWGWLGFPEQPYELPLDAQSGAIFGHASEDLDMTLLRLAENAAAHGWKVIFFDAQGCSQMAARFLATMSRHGKTRTHIFPNTPYDGLSRKSSTLFHHLLSALPAHEPHSQDIAALSVSALLTTYARPPRTMEMLAKRLTQLVTERNTRSARLRTYRHATLLTELGSMELLGPALRYAALSTLVGTRLDGCWTFGCSEAAYLSFDAWNRPEQARVLAQWLMRELASTLTEQTGESGRTLLLLKRPSLLFPGDQIAPLFALLEQYGGSVFLAERSPGDLGSDQQRILGSTSTLIVHGSSSIHPFVPYVRHLFPRSFSNARIGNLVPGQGYIIASGRVWPLRVKPVLIGPTALKEAQSRIPPYVEHEPRKPEKRPKAPSIWDGDLLDLEDDEFAHLDALEDWEDLLEPETPAPTTRASRRTRSKSMRSTRRTRAAAIPPIFNEEEKGTLLPGPDQT